MAETYVSGGASSSDAGLPLMHVRGCGLQDDYSGELHGDGDSDEGLPSEIGSAASGMPGDLPDGDGGEAVYIEPTLPTVDFSKDYQKLYTDGDWVHPEVAKQWRPESTGPRGTFGMFCANHGSIMRNQIEQTHCHLDLKTNPCQVVMMQEADDELLDVLKAPLDGPTSGDDGGVDPGSDTTAVAVPSTDRGGNLKKRKAHEFVGLCCQKYEHEDQNGRQHPSLLIAANRNTVHALYLKMFRIRADGKYTVRSKENKAGWKPPPKVKTAMTRIMVAALQMKHFKLRGRGGTGEDDDDELVVMNLHLNHMTAKKSKRCGSIAEEFLGRARTRHHQTWRTSPVWRF